MTTATIETRTDCPTWCRRIHDESPLESVLHESAAAEISSLASPNGLSKPAIRVSLGMNDVGRVFVLVGDSELTPGDAEDLMAALRTALNQAYVTLDALELADQMRAGVAR